MGFPIDLGGLDDWHPVFSFQFEAQRRNLSGWLAITITDLEQSTTTAGGEAGTFRLKIFRPELADELKKLFHGLDRLAESETRASGTADTDEAFSSENRPLGDFRVVREIGSGGMAKVFEAEQISLKRKVALKVLSPHLSLSEKAVQKFYREAIADLFSGPEDIHHVLEMLKMREVYRHLSNAADRGDEAANAISDIVVKKV